MSDEPELAEVYRAENGIAAQLLKRALESAGIRVKITDESFSALAGLNPIWWECPRILVPRHDIPKALAIIRDFEAIRAGNQPEHPRQSWE